MSCRLICFLLFYLIFGAAAAFTLYKFFTEFGGFDSIPNKLPDKLPDVPSSTPGVSVPTQLPNTPSFDDIKNNKWVYGGIGIGSVLIFALMTVCGVFWCFRCQTNNNNERVNRAIPLQQLNLLQDQSSSTLNSASLPHNNSHSAEQERNKIHQLLSKLSDVQLSWLETLLDAQEEINMGRGDDDLVQKQWQKAKDILSKRLSDQEIRIISLDRLKLIYSELQKIQRQRLQYQQNQQRQVQTIPPFASSSRNQYSFQ